MKALQDRGVAKEGVIVRLHKRIKILMDEEEQYKGTIRTLNQEVKDLMVKLEEEGCRERKSKKPRKLLEQVETARADAVNEYKASKPFIDVYVGYYGEGFEDYLKQVKSLYLYLDFSKVTMDEPLPSTPASDTVQEETDDSAESNPKDDNIVLAQPATNAPVTLLVPSTELVNIEDLIAQDIQEKSDGNPPNPPAL